MYKAKEQKAIQPLHSLSETEVVHSFQTNQESGLSSAEAQQRLVQYGPNIITLKKQRSALVRFLLQFNQPLVYILLGATSVTILLGEFTDAAVIFAVVFLNAVIGYVQETKAMKAIDALARSMSSRAQVMRDWQKLEVDARELVPGDIVLIQSGDKFPADVRLIRQRDLKIDESALTGESVAVEKNLASVAADTVLADRLNMGFATTVVTFGTGKGVVTATGDHTEVGKIQTSISSAQELETPLTIKIKQFSSFLLWVILGLAAVIFVIGLVRGETAGNMFMVAVAMAVGAIPEGLPAAVTIMLAIGVSKMAARKAIIRKLVAVETLGSTNVICSDKTGTLTENQMTVQKVYAGGSHYEFTGIGYRPEGEIIAGGAKIYPAKDTALELCLKSGMLCNDSQLVSKEERWHIVGDPTEGALLVSARKAGITEEVAAQLYPRLDSIPFESDYQYMATLHYSQQPFIFLKGSVEAVLDRCDNMLDADGNETSLDKELLHEEVNKMAAEGLRVLAFCVKYAQPAAKAIGHHDVASGMTFLGLQAMMDPPREEAKEAVALCRKAGIAVKMITGDHALTASAIAGRIGLSGRIEGGRLVALTGQDLQKISDKDLEEVAEATSVFARVSPDQKLRLVKALQARGKIVAMTGDGVNDGPALKQANIGIAMGITGTEVAKDAADMVLTDDNFSSIEGAVEEGRGVFDNLTKFIVWTLPTNLGEGLVIICAIILGTLLPIQPVQILWVNMATSVLLGLTLAFEPREPGIMDRPPRPADLPILTYELIMRTLLVGLLLTLAAFGLFLYERNILGTSLAEAQTVTATVFVVLESFYLINCRSLIRPMSEVGFFSNKWVYAGILLMVLFQLLFIYTPFMNSLFHSSPISLNAWVRIIGCGLILFAIVSLEKYIRWRVEQKKAVNKAL